MSMTVRDTGNLEQTPQGPLPVGNRCFRIPVASPKEIRRGFRQDVERFKNVLGKGNRNRRAGFLRVEAQQAVFNLLSSQTGHVTDSEAGMKQEQHEGADPSSVVISKSVVSWVRVAGLQDRRDLFRGERQCRQSR